MNRKQKSLAGLSEAMKYRETEEKADAAAGSIGDIVKEILSEPSAVKRKKLIEKFTARHSDAAAFFADNEDLINSEAELALLSSAVGGKVTEKEIIYRGGRKQTVFREKNIPPNVNALKMLLKNRMPDKYSDEPRSEIEIEDVSGTEEMIENAEEDDAEDESGKDHSV